MKTKRLLLAAALAVAAAACSADVTEPATRAAGPSNTEVTTTSVPDTTTARDGGTLGSGGGK